ncbi:hypothetical protein HOH87_01640 [bacterium]|nr:hypothetical protein [bacterium]
MGLTQVILNNSTVSTGVSKSLLSRLLLCLTGGIIALFICGSLAFAANSPIQTTLHMRLGNRAANTFLSGAHTLEVAIVPSDNVIALWGETYENVVLVNGFVTLQLGKDENNPIDPSLFNTADLRVQIIIEPASDPSDTNTVFVPLKTVPYTIHSYQSELAHDFEAAPFLALDHTNKRLGIGVTQNLTNAMEIDGTLRADKFVGDGSLITNIKYFIWQIGSQKATYMASGNVGIGTSTPDAKLHITQGLNIGQSVTINRTLSSSLSGGGEMLDSFASNMSHGTLPAARLSGAYSGVSGLGTVTANASQWNGNPIKDIFIADQFSMDQGTMANTNTISGALVPSNDFKIGSSVNPLTLTSPQWTITPDSIMTLSSVQTDSLTLSGNTFSGDQDIQVVDDFGLGFAINSSGNVSIATSNSTVRLVIEGGLKIASSSVALDGAISWNGNEFQGYRLNKWHTFHKFDGWTGDSLLASDSTTWNVVTITSAGNTGIGKPNSVESLEVSGNVVFQEFGNAPNLSISGPGTRWMWVTNKYALRSGLVSGSQWDDASVGVGSVAFGEDVTGIGDYSVIAGGKDITNSGDYSSVFGGSDHDLSGDYSLVLGGLGHINSGDYSIIGGGGASSNTQKNTISSDFSVVLGGELNTIGSAPYGTILGGLSNQVDGDFSMAIGNQAEALHSGSFVYADNTGAPFTSSLADTFLIRAQQVGIGTSNPTEALSVSGNVKASGFEGSGSLLLGDIVTETIDSFSATGNFTVSQIIYHSEPTGLMPNSTIDSTSIQNFTLLNEDFSADAVSGDKLDPEAITADDFEVNAITVDKLSDLAVSSANIADGIISDTNINSSAITSELIQNDSISSQNIATNAITESIISTNAITSEKIFEGAISSRNISNSAIVAGTFAEGAITSSNFKAGTITSANIEAGAIGAQHFSVSLPSTSFGPGSLDTSVFDENIISSTKIASGNLQWTHFPTDTLVPLERIQLNAIASDRFDASKADSEKFDIDSITTTTISDNAITNAKLEGIIPVSLGGTGTDTLAAESVVFVDASGGPTFLETNSGSNSALYWDNTNHRLGIQTKTPTVPLQIDGDLMVTRRLVFNRTSNINVDYIEFYTNAISSSSFPVSTAYISLQADQTPGFETGITGGLRAFDGAMTQSLTVGTPGSIKTNAQVLGSVSIGSGYTGTNIAPSDGLLIEGQVGISETAPDVAYLLDLNGGTINSNNTNGSSIGVDSTSTAFSVKGLSANEGVRGIGGITGVEGSSPSGTFGVQGSSLAISGTGVYGVGEAVTGGAQGVHGHVTGNAYDVSGYLGWVTADNSQVASVYGLTPNSPLNRNYAALFSGDVGIGGNSSYKHSTGTRLQIRGSTNDSSKAAIHVVNSNEDTGLFVRNDGVVGIGSSSLTSGVTLDVLEPANFQGVVSVTQQAITAAANQAIDWTDGNVVKLTVSSNTILTFNPPSHSAHLRLLIIHDGTGQISWDEGNTTIKWLKDAQPGLTFASGAIDIVSFYYDHDNNTYYGGASFDYN